MQLTKNQKKQYINLLNDCLKRAINGSSQYSLYENEFVSKITLAKLPEFVKNETIKINTGVNLNVKNHEKCTIFNKEYNLITVATTKEFDDFVETYFIKSTPKIIGIDCESKYGKLATIKLATKQWLCILDIHVLPKQDWVKFFKHIFDNSSIIPVGFAFGSDFAVICNTFPYLKDYFKKESRKILCISKLVQSILENSEAKNAVFSKRLLNGNSLKDVSDAILGGNLNKNLKHGSSWIQRPLTHEQKLYAVTDALVVILIKEKIEALLKGKLAPAAISKLITKSYIHYGMKSAKVAKPNIPSLMSLTINERPTSDLCIVTESSRSISLAKTSKCKNCSSTNSTSIPSPLYILTHKIITMIKDGEYYGLAEWKELEKAALNVKNMSCNDYNGFKAKLLINETKKASKKVVFDCGKYQLMPLTFQLFRKSDNKSFNIKLSEKVFCASKPGITHLLCLSCANIYLKDESNFKNGYPNKKNQHQQNHVVKEEITRQKIFELLCDIFEHKN